MTFSPGDLKDVANLVARKLEVYMNKERRETRFQPAGCFRTTKKMQKYDLLQRVMETSDLEQIPAPPSKSPQRKSVRRMSPDRKVKMPHRSRKQDASRERKGTKDKRFDVPQSGKDKRKAQSSDSDRRGEADKRRDKDGVVLKRETWVRVVDDDESFSLPGSPDMKLSISPKLKKTPLSVVAKKEAVRLSEYASNVFDGHDLDKLQVIHRYRPNSSDVPHITENGKVQNYTCHVGSALHAKKYVDYYMKEGLQTGKKEYSKRLQELKRGTPTLSEKGSEKGSVQSVKTAASASTARSDDYRNPCRERTRGTLPPITSADLVSPHSSHSMQSSDSSMSSRYSSSSFNSELTSTYKIVSTSLSQVPPHQPHPPVQPLRRTMPEPPCIQTIMCHARPGSARLAERRYVPVVRDAFLVEAEDKEIYSPRSLKLDRASSTTDLLPRLDNYTQTPRDSATQTPRRYEEHITTEDTVTNDTSVDQETQTPRSSRHGLKKKRRKKYENLELILQSSDATESVDSEIHYEDRRSRKKTRHSGVSSTSDSFRSTSTQEFKNKVCQTSFILESEESFPSLQRRHRNLSETITLKSVEDDPLSSLPNSTIHLFKEENMSDSVFDSEEQNGRYIGSAMDSEKRADVGSSEEYVAYDRAGEGEKTPDMKETEQHGHQDTDTQLEDCPRTLGNESNEDSFWETRGVKDSPHDADSGNFVEENVCSASQNDPEDQTSTQDTSQLESAQTKESQLNNIDSQVAVVTSEVFTVSPENVTVEEPASTDTATEVLKTDTEVAVTGEDAKNLSDNFDDVCRGAVELPSFDEDPRGDRIFSDIEGTMEEYRGIFLNNLSETFGSDSSSRYQKFPSNYMYVPEDRGSDGDTLVDSDTDPEVYTKCEKIFTREGTDEQLEMDEELCRGAAPVKRKNSEASSYCSATRAQGEISPIYQEVTVSRANSVASQATLSSVRGSRISTWKKDTSGKTASDQSEKSEQTAGLDQTQDLLNDEDFLEIAENYEAEAVKGPTALAADVDPITDERTSSCSRGSGDKVLSPESEMPSRGEEEFLNLKMSKDEIKCETVDIPVDTEDMPASCSLSTGTVDVKKISDSEFDASSPVPADAEVHEADIDTGVDENKNKEDRLEATDSESRGNMEKTQHELTVSSRGEDELTLEPLDTTKDDNNQIQETHDNSELDVKYEPDDSREQFDTAVSEGPASETKDETTAEAGVARPDSSCSTSRGFVINDSSLQGSSQVASSRGHHDDETVASFEESSLVQDSENIMAVNKNTTDYVTDDNFNSERKQLQESTVPTVCSEEERGDGDLLLSEGNELGVSKMPQMDEISDRDYDFKENMKSTLPHEVTSKNVQSDDEVVYSDPSVSKPRLLRPASAHCTDSPSASPTRPISAHHVTATPLTTGSAGMSEDTAIPDELHIEIGNTDDDTCKIQTSDPKDLMSQDESRGQIDTTLDAEVTLCEGEEQATSHPEEPRLTEDTQILQINRPSSTKDETVDNSVNIILDVGALIKSTTLKDNQRRPVSAHGMRSNPAPSPRQRPVSALQRQMPDMIIEGSSGEQCGTVAGSVMIADDDVSKGNSGINEGGTAILDESRGQMDVQVETLCKGDHTDRENTFEENEPRESETELRAEMEPAVPERLTLKIEQPNQQDMSSQILTHVNTHKDDIENVRTMEPNTDSEEEKAEQKDVTDLDMLTEHPERPGSSLSIERGESTNTPRPALSLPRTKLERSDSVCSRGSESDDNSKICSKESEGQKAESGDKESVDQGPGSVCLDPSETDTQESKPDAESHPEGQSLEINTPVANETDTIPRDITHDGQEDDACDVTQERPSQISEFQDVKEDEESIYVSFHRGSITHRHAVLSEAVLTGVLSPTPSPNNEESCVSLVCRDPQTHGISHDDTQQGQNIAIQGDVMTNLKTTDLCLPDDKSDEKPAPKNLISKNSLNFFSFDDPDGSKVGQSFASSEESATFQTSTDTVMNDSTESSTTCNTTKTTNTLEEHYTRTDQLIPVDVSQDSSGIRYAVLESKTGNYTAQDVLVEKMDEVPTAGIKCYDPESYEDSVGCEEVDEYPSQGDGTSPVGTLRPLSVLGLPQKDLSNRRLSLESRGSSEFIIETDEVPIVSSRGDENLPENTVGELPPNDNLPESQTFINGYLRIKPAVVEHRGDEVEESYCSLAAPSACTEETQDDNTTQKGQGDGKVINSPSCTQPSPLESKLADYLGNINMNSLMALVDESPVDVDYTKSEKSKQASYHLVLNEEQCEPDSGSLGDTNAEDKLGKAPDDRSGSSITSLEDKSELSVVKNIPVVSVDPEQQEINNTHEGMMHKKQETTGRRKSVTFVDGHLSQEDIHTSNFSPQGSKAETRGSNEEKLTNESVLKSQVMMSEVILHRNTDIQEDLKPPKTVQEEKLLPAPTLQTNINHATKTVPERGVSENKTTNPNNEPTSNTTVMPGHRRKSTSSLQRQTAITGAEASSRQLEKVDVHVPISEINTNQGHRRQLTSLHGQTVFKVAESPRGLSEKVKEPEDRTASLQGNQNLSISLPGKTVLTVAEAGQVSGAAAIVQCNNEAVDRQVEQTSGHGVITVSERERLPEKAPHKHVTQREEQNRMTPSRNEEHMEEVKSDQFLDDTENTDPRDSNDHLSDGSSALKPAIVSDSVSTVPESRSDATGLNGDTPCGRQQTITSQPSGMHVSGNMAESDGQSVSESKMALHSDQMSGHRIILVSESLPAPIPKAKVIERRPGGSTVILVSEKSEV